VGAKTWMLAYVDGDAADILRSRPELDREAASALVRKLFPSETLEEIDDGDLCFTCPPDDELCVGCFQGLSIVAAKEFGIDYPSKVPAHFLGATGSARVYLHAMHSVVDWFAYAVWEKGQLQRSLSLSPDSGILEDIGSRRRFEEPYWSGQHPAVDPEEASDYPFPFHPLELGEAALLDLFGYQLEGTGDSAQVEPEQIPLARFKRKKRRWKLW
jgi:hypothetical protein